MNAFLNRGLLWYVLNSPLQFKRAGVYNRLVEPELMRRPIRRVVPTRVGPRLFCDTQDLIQRRLYAFGVWEPGLTAFVSSRLRPGDAFIDVGANVGYYTLLASPLVGPAGRVVAVEPSPSIGARLAENIRLNGYENIRVSATAASDSRGTATLHQGAATNSGESSLLASRGLAEESTVETATLGEILSPEELRTARLIKIDVEGFEAHVVRGLVAHLPATREDVEIVMEISAEELIEQGTSSADLIAMLSACGFQPYLIENYYHPHLYVKGKFCSRAVRLRHDLKGDVPFDVVFSRLDVPAIETGEPPYKRFGFTSVPETAWN